MTHKAAAQAHPCEIIPLFPARTRMSLRDRVIVYGILVPVCLYIAGVLLWCWMRSGRARRGAAGLGWVWLGKARLGLARHG